MSRYRDVRIVLLVGSLWSVSHGLAWAQEMAPPVPVTPQRLEISTPEAPVRVRADEAQLLIERLFGTATGPAAPQPEPVPPGGIRRTIQVPPPTAVNATPHFQFRDLTERSEPAQPELSPEQRRTAVEAYRQSLVRGKGAGR